MSVKIGVTYTTLTGAKAQCALWSQAPGVARWWAIPAGGGKTILLQCRRGVYREIVP